MAIPAVSSANCDNFLYFKILLPLSFVVLVFVDLSTLVLYNRWCKISVKKIKKIKKIKKMEKNFETFDC